MIDSIIAFSVKHRFAVIFVTALVTCVGIYAAKVTPIDAIPDLSENQVIVFTDWIGRSPQEIEDQITYPLALALKGIQDVRVIRTSSDIGFSMIHVVFTDAVDIAAARKRVEEHLLRGVGNLPTGVTPRLAPEAPATGQVLWYTLEGNGFDLGELRTVQDTFVGPQLASVDGVAEVAGVGGYAVEYHVEIDPQKLTAAQLSVSDVYSTLEREAKPVGGHVVEKAGQEFVVQSDSRFGKTSTGDIASEKIRTDLENVVLRLRDGTTQPLGTVARVTAGPAPRRGVFEKDGNEVVGGVVMMRYGENPVEVVQRVIEKMKYLGRGLPAGMRLDVGYQRTPLIRAAVGTVRSALIEAIVTASICVLIVMRHLRSVFIIAVTLPISTLVAFIVMWGMRRLGWANVETNIMSLAGLSISIGVLVDSSIVMTENVVHQLHERFGAEPVHGDVREVVVRACQMVGRPIFFSVLIMLLSFLPVFGLSGMEGKMFRPLAFTKTFAALAVAILAITLVPALCSILVRGKLRAESDSWVVRMLADVYRPLLSFFLDRPAAMLWVIAVTFLTGIAPLGSDWLSRGGLGIGLIACGLAASTWRSGLVATGSLIVVALLVGQMRPVESEFVTPLDEGVVMDMPITIPRIAIGQAANDLKARDMMLCRFPEVDMVMGKVGRADTPTDPAPIDMIETMVMMRPHEFWPRRKLTRTDARRFVEQTLDELSTAGVIEPFSSTGERSMWVDRVVTECLPRFDALMREFAYHRYRELDRELQAKPREIAENIYETYRREWLGHVAGIQSELIERASATWIRLMVEEVLFELPLHNDDVAIAAQGLAKYRSTQPSSGGEKTAVPAKSHHATTPPPNVDPIPIVSDIQVTLADRMRRQLVLWKASREDIGAFGAEMDQAVQLPGWTNVWTRPIQNRVDMLNTGVDTLVGVRVLGQSQRDVAEASEGIADVLREIRGAANVIADPIRGKGYLQIDVDRERAAAFGVSVPDAQDVVEAATGGRIVGNVSIGRERHAIRVKLARAWRDDEEKLKRLSVPTANQGFVFLEQIATIRTAEGPAAIKGDNGLLRNYVRLDVRGRDVLNFVEEAKRRIAVELELPTGVYLEWTGRFERWNHFATTLKVVAPVVLLLIFVLLVATYRDVVDAILMILAVPGALAGGVFMLWLFNFKLSITVAMGFVACFGMATATGVIMLVYLRQAIAQRGGLENMTLTQVRDAVLCGAVNRLRPKLLTEATTIIGLAPMLWAGGVGAEIIRPMAAPVLGGILIADEVIDLFLPVLFYWVRRARWKQIQLTRGNNNGGSE